jgi:integrase
MKASQNKTGTHYTVPQLCQTSNDWYVYFRFYHDGKWVMKKCREGINRIENKKERLKEAEALAEARLTWLQQGWNPIIDPEFKARKLSRNIDLKAMLFGEALDFALEKKKPDLAKKSYQDYRNIVKLIKEYAPNTGIAFIQIQEVNRLHILQLMQNVVELRKISNHRHNIILGCLRSLFTTLETWLVVLNNPATKITMKPVAESNHYATFTEEEKERIAEFLQVRQPNLFRFSQLIYQTGIRPKELLSLKICDIDLNRRLITIVPDLKEENSKTKFVRQVPINGHVLGFLMEMNLGKFPNSYYLFGSPFESGKGNRGAGSMKQKKSTVESFKTGIAGAMREDFLMPSPNRVSRDTVTKLWQKLVKDKETGLGINKCMYAAKHTGADDKILAGIELDALKTLYGHRSKQMTERYAKAVKDIYHSSIIENSPPFTAAKVIRIA